MASKSDNQRPGTERRVFNLTECEVRSADNGATVFTGYAAVFGELSVNLGGFRERIQPGCFRNAVEEGQDVRFLINHDSNLVLGRTASGTVQLAEDERGLKVECELPDTSYARDLEVSMRRHDINQMSFGFITRADEWKDKDEESGLPIRELVAADLFDVSVVTYPAYPDTSAEVRSWIAENEPELLERAAQAAAELAEEPEARDEETPAGEQREEEPAADEPEEAAASEEPAADEHNADDMLEQATVVLAATGEVIEAREGIVRPDLKAFREFVEERGWDWDDDYCLWSLTQMLELCSTLMLLTDDDEAPMKQMAASMMSQLSDAVAACVADAGSQEGEREEQPEEREEEAPRRSRSLDVERRRLELLERSLDEVL